MDMDLEKLEKMAKLVLKDLSSEEFGEVSDYDDLTVKLKNLMALGIKTLPEHQELFVGTHASIKGDRGISIGEACSVIRHLLDIIEIEKMGKRKIEGMKVFESAEEKMKQAGLSFRNEDCSSAFNNLNTALELVLKDKCGIPTTITGINTSNVIDLLVKEKTEPYAHFREARKRVTEIANRVKHQGYVPSKSETILGMKAMEELISKLRDKEIKLTEEVRKKIYDGL